MGRHTGCMSHLSGCILLCAGRWVDSTPRLKAFANRASTRRTLYPIAGIVVGTSGALPRERVSKLLQTMGAFLQIDNEETQHAAQLKTSVLKVRVYRLPCAVLELQGTSVCSMFSRDSPRDQCILQKWWRSSSSQHFARL